MAGGKVDVQKALNTPLPETIVSYNRRDLILYSLGIGVTHPNFTHEFNEEFGVFPTYPVVLGLKGASSDIVNFEEAASAIRFPGLEFDPSMILHGEQGIEILQHPLPLSGTFINKAKILGVYDKGSGALVRTQTLMCTEKGVPLVKLTSGTFIRGLGGFGGDKGPSGVVNVPPKRAPDAVEEIKTLEWQALLYRLSGDYNQLHANPALAQMVGFEKPILHGLCSLGACAHAVLKTFCDYDAKKFKSINVRFSSPVYPGETLVVEMWREGATKIIFQMKVKERNKVAISNAAVELNDLSSKL